MKLYTMVALLATSAVTGFFSVAHMLEYYERAGLDINPFNWYDGEATNEVAMHGRLYAIMTSGAASTSYLVSRYMKY